MITSYELVEHVQAEADFRQLVESVDDLKLNQQQQQQQPSPAHKAAAAKSQAEASRLAGDNAALRRRLERTHRLVGAMQVRIELTSL